MLFQKPEFQNQAPNLHTHPTPLLALVPTLFPLQPPPGPGFSQNTSGSKTPTDPTPKASEQARARICDLGTS
jgi:hypothetical protein